jgi:hypothetical protein
MKKATIALLSLITLFSGASIWAGEIYHQRGIELRGGQTLYTNMTNPSDWALQFPPYTLTEEMENAPNFGLSLLYKSHNNFVWNIGYNHLFNTNTIFGNGAYEEVVEANEFFIVPSFVLFPNSIINFSFGAGATLLMASLDRTSPMTGDLGVFYGAKGRNLGVIALVNGEFLFLPNFSLKIGAGFRNVVVNDIDFVKTVAGSDQSFRVMWTDSNGIASNRAYELNFTGPFLEFGLRWYFEVPK